MIKYINSKGKRAGKLHRKKNASKIISKGFFAPKKQDKQQEKDISRRRVHAKKHGILREMFFLGDRIKKCHYPTAPSLPLAKLNEIANPPAMLGRIE